LQPGFYDAFLSKYLGDTTGLLTWLIINTGQQGLLTHARRALIAYKSTLQLFA